jgi:VWFA-related protein
MKLLSVAGLLLLTAGAPALAASPAASPPDTPSFGEVLEVNVVNVDVTATGKDGRRVTGLKKDDFELLEDGKRVAISNFEAALPGTLSAGGSPAGAAATGPAGGPGAGPAGGGPPDEALNLVIFFDNLDLRPAHRTRVVRQIREFLARQLAPGDRVMLATYDLGLHVRFGFTSDPATIAKGLREAEGLATHGDESDRDRRTALDAMMTIQRESLAEPDPIPCPLNIVTPAQAYASVRRQEVVQTINALTVLVNSLSGVPGRKAVLHVSDGLPLLPGEELFQFLLELCGGGGTAGIGSIPPSRPGAPKEDPDDLRTFDTTSLDARSYQAASQAMMDAQHYSIAKNLQTLASHANAHRVTLYTLQAAGLQAPDAADASFAPNERLYQFQSISTIDRSNQRDSLQMLADDTGGRAILDANDALPDLARMREDFSSSYSLGFTPQGHSGDGREHRLEIRVKRPGIRLRYRQSYRDKPVMEKAVDRTLAALFYGIEDNPLRVVMEIGEPAPAEGGQYAVPVHLKIPLFKLAIVNRQDTYEGKLRILVAVRDDTGATSAVRQVEVPLHISRKEVLNAMGQYYLYTLTLKLKPGEQHVAVAVRDDFAAATSYLSRPVTVAARAAANR